MSARSAKSVFVLGYTGETGKAMVKELSRGNYFSRVVLIGRRKVDLPEDVNTNFVSFHAARSKILSTYGSWGTLGYFIPVIMKDQFAPDLRGKTKRNGHL